MYLTMPANFRQNHRTAYIGLGSNLSFPQVRLQRALREIAQLPRTRLLRVSSLYHSAPQGPHFQPWYYNRVVAIDTRLSAMQLLRALQTIEKKHRRRRRLHWGPRTLDLDILLYGQRCLRHRRLTVPHPHMHKRAFVMLPLYEIASDRSLPNHGKIAAIVKQMATDNIVKVIK